MLGPGCQNQEADVLTPSRGDECPRSWPHLYTTHRKGSPVETSGDQGSEGGWERMHTHTKFHLEQYKCCASVFCSSQFCLQRFHKTPGDPKVDLCLDHASKNMKWKILETTYKFSALCCAVFCEILCLPPNIGIFLGVGYPHCICHPSIDHLERSCHEKQVLWSGNTVAAKGGPKLWSGNPNF